MHDNTQVVAAQRMRRINVETVSNENQVHTYTPSYEIRDKVWEFVHCHMHFELLLNVNFYMFYLYIIIIHATHLPYLLLRELVLFYLNINIFL